MRTRNLLTLLLLLVACGAALSNENPEDVQLDNVDLSEPEDEPIEGSGAGVLVPPVETTTETIVLEEINPTITPLTTESDKYVCPEVCTCNTEMDGENTKFIVDCSDKSLEELPVGIDTRATEINLQNNKIKIIPKSISELKHLKVLNANNNAIEDLAAGSISELAELKVLKLSNNRLLEYPLDLKNGFALVQLEEIDLSGNDIRSTLSVENFSNFVALRKLVLPTSDKDFVEVLCNKLKKTLETVCVGSCLDWTNDCPDAPEHVEEDFLGGKLPGTISLTSSMLDVAPFEGVAENDDKKDTETPEIGVNEDKDEIATQTAETVEETTASNAKELASIATRKSVLINDSTKSAAPVEDVASQTTDATNENSEVKVGATTSNTNTGAVDKSIIGIIVAGMVVIVAGITIKKNWTSLKKRFGSGGAPERTAVNGNGTSPEEVPLQDKDKSPV